MEFGDYRVKVIPDSEFRLDGGAMFGVVPLVLWSRYCPPDSQNRILMNMNCLFVETPQEKILIETGIGEKWSPEKTELFGISRKRSLADSLQEIAGCTPDDITIVVNTHLHFDHAGGNTILDNESGKPVPQFRNARYFVSKSELEHANDPHERDRASYLSENWMPLISSGQLVQKPDVYEVVPGLTLEQIRGHSETMQTVKLSRGGKTLYGFADLIPMKPHVKLPWIAGFDLFPLETLEAKRNLLLRAYEEKWICLFYHENGECLFRISQQNGKYEAVALSEQE